MRKDVSPPVACTLGADARSTREAEFRELFAVALRRIDRPRPNAARLIVGGASDDVVRDLFAREQLCCAFFELAFQAVEDTLVVTISVPEGSEASLEYLLALATPA